MRDARALWEWLRDTAVPNIYFDKDYNDQYNTLRDRMFMSDMVSFRVGAVQLRQLRIQPGTGQQNIFFVYFDCAD